MSKSDETFESIRWVLDEVCMVHEYFLDRTCDEVLSLELTRIFAEKIMDKLFSFNPYGSTVRYKN